jgi:hypothetical protein
MGTPPEEIELLRALTPRKLAIMQSLIQQAYDLKRAWVRARSPELTERELMVRVREQVSGTGP